MTYFLKKIFKLFKLSKFKLWRKGLLNGIAATIELENMVKDINPETSIDVGSNKGQFIILIEKLFPNKTVYSFEPIKEMINKQKKFFDFRGNLRETFRKKIIKWDDLIFDFATVSKKNVLRGFHFQYKFQQAKFVTVLKGKILDCVIDLRKGSKTFGKSYKIELSEENFAKS